MGYFVGIDGGGSKTAVWCADEKGQIIGKGKSGPTNLTTTDVATAVGNLKSAISQAVKELASPRFEAVVMGLAGMDTAAELDQAKNTFSEVFLGFQFPEVTMVNDAMIALKSGTDNSNAMVVIAGTGSNCIGRNAQGQEAKSGGLDYWLSDEGSGFAIGVSALKAVVQATDGRGELTALRQPLLQHFNCTSTSDLKTVVYGSEFSKREMAEIARIVVKAAENGDRVAHKIMIGAILDIQQLLSAVATGLSFKNQAFDCVMVGSVNSLSFVRTRIALWFAATYPTGKLVYPDKPPVFGALQMAYQAAFLSAVAR